MNVLTSERVPIKIWLDDLEDSAIEQSKNLASLPFVFKHVALMPDSHSGFGMPIGGVLATKNTIIPNAVGVDISCGVNAVRTSLTDIDTNTIKKIMSEIRKEIPVGFNKHKDKQTWIGYNDVPNSEIIKSELENSKFSLGSLGGGNHFWELSRSSDSFIWVMIHSGSRNFGLKIANHHHEIAKSLCEKYYSNIPTSDLSFLPFDSVEGQNYYNDMMFAMKFAKENRKRMMDKTLEIITSITQGTELNRIDVHHNYAAMEHHYNENVIVHRKGAISARVDEIGIIPGSQGTKSYITLGKGNKESFTSCSHGAGRKMSRTKAQKDLNLDDEIKKLNDQGIVHSIRSVKDLDEASGAYKNISVVMNNQKDLCSIMVELSPLAVIKG